MELFTRIYVQDGDNVRCVARRPNWDLIAVELGTELCYVDESAARPGNAPVRRAGIVARKLVDTDTGELALELGQPLYAEAAHLPPPASCSVTGCTRQARAKGLCSTHYERARTGAPLETPVHEKQRRAGRPMRPNNPRRTESRGSRRVECPSYNTCLEKASARDWPGFTCKQCTGATP